MKLNKKGMTIGDLQAVGISFIVIAIALGLGASVLSSVQSTQTTGGYASNISGYGLSAIQTLSSWLPTVALVVVIAVILGVVMMYLARQGQ